MSQSHGKTDIISEISPCENCIFDNTRYLEKSQLCGEICKIKTIGQKIGFQLLKLKKKLTSTNEHYLPLSLIVFEI